MKIDARGWIFQIKDKASEMWLDIGGVNTFEEDPSEGGETVDTTTFLSDGEAESEAMQRGGSLNLEGFKDYDDDSGERDPGQAACDVLCTKKSRESLGTVRFRHDTQDEWTEWTAHGERGGSGGGNNDKTSWSVTFTRSGKARVTAVEPTSEDGAAA